MTIYTQPTTYMVGTMPFDNMEAHAFTITVEWRGGDRWAVCRAGQCATKTGRWSHERQPSSRTDYWKRTHRFDLDTALALAEKLAPKLKLMGKTAEEIIAQQEEWAEARRKGA